MPESYTEALTKELITHGVEEWYLDETGKHNKLRFRWQDRLLMHVFPKTGSDSQHGLLNSLSDLRKQLGVRKVLQKSENRTEKNRARPVAPGGEQLHITTRPDPFAVLAALNKKPAPPPPRVAPRMTLGEVAQLIREGKL